MTVGPFAERPALRAAPDLFSPPRPPLIHPRTFQLPMSRFRSLLNPLNPKQLSLLAFGRNFLHHVCSQLSRGDWLSHSNQIFWGDLSTPESCEERWRSLVAVFLVFATALWSAAAWSALVLWSYYRERVRQARKGAIELIANGHRKSLSSTSSSSPSAPHSHHLSTNVRRRSSSLSLSLSAAAGGTSSNRKGQRILLLPLDSSMMGGPTTPPALPALELTPPTPTSPTGKGGPTSAPPNSFPPPLPSSSRVSLPSPQASSSHHNHHRHHHHHNKQGVDGGGGSTRGGGTKRRLTYPSSRESQSGVIVYAPVLISEEEAKRMGGREGFWRSCSSASSPSSQQSPSSPADVVDQDGEEL
jgi:hypothetical protein